MVVVRRIGAAQSITHWLGIIKTDLIMCGLMIAIPIVHLVLHNSEVYGSVHIINVVQTESGRVEGRDDAVD